MEILRESSQPHCLEMDLRLSLVGTSSRPFIRTMSATEDGTEREFNLKYRVHYVVAHEKPH